ENLISGSLHVLSAFLNWGICSPNTQWTPCLYLLNEAQYLDFLLESPIELPCLGPPPGLSKNLNLELENRRFFSRYFYRLKNAVLNVFSLVLSSLKFAFFKDKAYYDN